MRLATLALAILASVSAFADTARLCPTTQLATERVVLSTSSGDLVIGLYPQVAPEHTAQILRLARAGVYDGTAFLRVIPGFAAQLGGVARRGPMTGEQVKLITRIKAEFNGCPHRRGTVSMAHDPDDVNSAQTSFLLMFSEIPQMNGRFTVVGEVLSGESVLADLEHVATNPNDNQPLGKVEVKSARVVSEGEASRVQASLPVDAEELPHFFLPLAALVALAGALLLAVGWRHRTRRALGLLWLLAGGFGLFVVFAPLASATPGLPIAIFAACLGMFRLLSAFETA